MNTCTILDKMSLNGPLYLDLSSTETISLVRVSFHSCHGQVGGWFLKSEDGKFLLSRDGWHRDHDDFLHPEETYYQRDNFLFATAEEELGFYEQHCQTAPAFDIRIMELKHHFDCTFEGDARAKAAQMLGEALSLPRYLIFPE